MVILGIDPGTATTGYGVIRQEGQRLTHLGSGVILTAKTDAMPDRLLAIYTQLNRLLDAHEPDVVVTEQLFFGKNATTALQVGRTIGIVVLAAAQRGTPWLEYRPSEVKLAVVGYGAAEKKQVQYMVARLLGLDKVPKPDDAADALAIAVCHAHTAPLVSQKSALE